MSEEIPILTKNQFKQTSRYLQEQLSKELQSDIKLSTCQEALCRIMGFSDLHAYQHWISVAESMPAGDAEYANGDLAKEIQSLRFCINAAQGGYSTALRIRSILLHLYNNRWPCKIELKNFDRNHAIHLLNCIALDSRPHHEIHQWIPESHALFRKWAQDEIDYMTVPQSEGEKFVKFFLLNYDKSEIDPFLRYWRSYGSNREIDEAIENLDEDTLKKLRTKVKEYF